MAYECAIYERPSKHLDGGDDHSEQSMCICTFMILLAMISTFAKDVLAELVATQVASAEFCCRYNTNLNSIDNCVTTPNAGIASY